MPSSSKTNTTCTWLFGSDDEEDPIVVRRRSPEHLQSVLTRKIPGGTLRKTANLEGDLLTEIRLYNVQDIRGLEGLDRCERALFWLRLQGDKDSPEFETLRKLMEFAKRKFPEEGKFFAEKKKN